ncbi:MAG: hypothetical protein ACKV2V_15495 [Blastocatellia bacterium]
MCETPHGKQTRSDTLCHLCGVAGARHYQQLYFSEVGMPCEEGVIDLCVKCARAERGKMRAANRSASTATGQDDSSISREELIAAMDRFWRESGAGDICGRCHRQGTGCCPPMCRHLGAAGCLRKNVFCTSFVCGALLNAIAECDADTGRLLKWMKGNPGSAEFRLYEMVTRVPPADREQTRPLILPEHYPGPLPLSGAAIREQLEALADEVLEIRQRWHREEQARFPREA